MNEFDVGLEKLLRGDYETRPYGRLVSLEEERQEAVEIFYDHVSAARGLPFNDDGGLSVEEMIAIDTVTPTSDNNLNQSIANLMKQEEEKLLWAVRGDKHVSGEGIYLCLEEDVDGEAVTMAYVLDEGDVLIGESASVGVREVVPYAYYQKVMKGGQFANLGDKVCLDHMTGICLELRHTKRHDVSGNVHEDHGTVFVPLTYESLKFAAIERQQFTAPEDGGGTAVAESLHSLLAGVDFRETCTDIENDLTYGAYEEAEFADQYQAHLNELREQTQYIDYDVVMIASGKGEDIAHNSVTLAEAKAYYCGATILRQGETWRVVHGFSVDDELVHILPEHLVWVEMCDE